MQMKDLKNNGLFFRFVVVVVGKRPENVLFLAWRLSEFGEGGGYATMARGVAVMM